jgi:hypothetical protein
MNTTDRQPSVTQFVQGSMTTTGNPPGGSSGPPTWPSNSESQARCDALVQEVLAELQNEASVENRVAGYQSESQGE